jgi:hypothetical protein
VVLGGRTRKESRTVVVPDEDRTGRLILQ